MADIAPTPTRAERRMSGAARRDHIIQAASAVFGRLGFEAARMDDVAKEAGIAKGLLYKHFASKDSLFRALVDQQGRLYATELRSALAGEEPSTDPTAALRAGLAFWLHLLGDDGASFNLADPGGHDAYEGLRESLREVIADAIRAAVPGVPEPYPRLVAALIQGSAESLGLVWRDHTEEVDEAEALDLLAQFCSGGLARLGSPGS